MLISIAVIEVSTENLIDIFAGRHAAYARTIYPVCPQVETRRNQQGWGGGGGPRWGVAASAASVPHHAASRRPEAECKRQPERALSLPIPLTHGEGDAATPNAKPLTQASGGTNN